MALHEMHSKSLTEQKGVLAKEFQLVTPLRTGSIEYSVTESISLNTFKMTHSRVFTKTFRLSMKVDTFQVIQIYNRKIVE